MPSKASHEHHQMNYIEITVNDMSRSTKFYSNAFGWEFNDYGPEYTGIQGTEREMGGFTLNKKHKGQTNPACLVILYSKNLDKSVEAVKEAGGKILKAPFAFPGGRRFHFADPNGNELAVWAEA